MSPLGVLGSLDPERAHRTAMLALKLAAGPGPFLTHRLRLLGRAAGAAAPCEQPTRLWGANFPNRLGLAAGLDKDAEAVLAWASLGFGFAEIGTVTPRPQGGNPRPRIFRIPEHAALINRMGFPSAGKDAVEARLAAAAATGMLDRIPLGVNVGKNRDTANEQAWRDYLAVARQLSGYATYVCVNVSSPNTPGLRDLESPTGIRSILAALADADLQGRWARRPAVLVKISPDVAEAGLERLVDAALAEGAAGFIATNTTVARPAVSSAPLAAEQGGLSGPPLAAAATSALAGLRRAAGNRLVLIGAGGIDGAFEARRRLQAGADLLQVYTAFTYEGPRLVREIAAGLQRRPH
ncbi:MAG: quinone-dependent dihydroorotate dehydrogenase [Candidatus Schekmanbacteria bacterium]|nr:quinone-dependent dihydroorotate dehydrogenase [Candidatus Schekmanbacteria bacterium]